MAVIEQRETKLGKVVYRVKIRIKGFPAETASFARKTDAKLWAQQTESAIRQGKHFKTSESKKRTFGELIDRYIERVLPTKPKSEKKQAAQLLWWKQRLGKYSISEITSAKIAECRDELLNGITCRGTKRGPATTVRYLAVLSHACSIAVKEWLWMEDNPVTKVTKPQEPRGRVRFLTADERRRLLDACNRSTNSNLFPAVVLGLATALRRSEILNLQKEDISFSKERITIYQTKNNEIKVAPLVGFAKRVILDHIDKLPDASIYVFPSLKKNYSQKEQKPGCIRNAWERAVVEANLQDMNFHCLRHDVLSQMAMAGASLRELQEVANHKSLSMVVRYTHLSEQHTKQLVTRVNKKMFEGFDSVDK